jgi:ppGpp synthetase/RelA/SpoT-type nucleotidyltranferase
MVSSVPASGPLLSEPQIEVVVQRYLREMARFEKTASAVAERLRRELRAEGHQRYLVSFRAKHPDDLREKLRRRSEDRDARYSFDALMYEIGEVVTDLAGCRVVVYSVPDEERVAALVRRVFALPNRDDAQPPPIRRRSGYQATHTLVLAPEAQEDASIRGSICEVQVATVAAHLFNELEHDITYKRLGHAATDPELRLLASVERACKLADHVVEQLLDERARGKAQRLPLEDPAELRLALEQAAGRPLIGDFARLFKMLDMVVEPLTAAALEQLGKPKEVLARGQVEATRLGVHADDVITYVLGLLPELEAEFALIAAHWRGPVTALRRAIQAAVGRGHEIDQTAWGDDDDLDG